VGGVVVGIGLDDEIIGEDFEDDTEEYEEEEEDEDEEYEEEEEEEEEDEMEEEVEDRRVARVEGDVKSPSNSSMGSNFDPYSLVYSQGIVAPPPSLSPTADGGRKNNKKYSYYNSYAGGGGGGSGASGAVSEASNAESHTEDGRRNGLGSMGKSSFEFDCGAAAVGSARKKGGAERSMSRSRVQQEQRRLKKKPSSKDAAGATNGVVVEERKESPTPRHSPSSHLGFLSQYGGLGGKGPLSLIPIPRHPTTGVALSPQPVHYPGAGGGVPGSLQDGTFNGEIYFMGIIDILQQYTVRKQGENFFKSLVYPSSAISSVSPKFYASKSPKTRAPPHTSSQ